MYEVISISEELLVRCCAPTLASLKTGSLFTCRAPSRKALHDSIRSVNRRLGRKGLRVIPLRYNNGVGLVYVFRPSQLSKDLTHQTSCRLLSDRGYCCENASKCIMRLIARLNQQQEFPHEIGLFLGYPPEDVDGFINRRDECKSCGRWKVYGDVDRAERTFAKYKKCTDVYLKHLAKGSRIEKLTVAV